MNKKLSWIRQLQKQALQAAETLSDKSAATLGEAKVGLQKLDDQFDITIKLKDAGARIASAVRQADQDYALSDKANALKQSASAIASKARKTAINVADETGLNTGATRLADTFQSKVAAPVEKLAKKSWPGPSSQSSRQSA